jgi:hypothetical protein
MKFVDPDIDHIDPLWKEGRDYQLICGRECPENLIERESRFNTAKTNRFLPWRVASDEISTIPVNQGDLCLFLVGADIEKDIPGKWVLMEFLSEEWFAATKNTAGGCRALEEYRQYNLDNQVQNLTDWQRNNRGVTTRLQWEYYQQNPDKLKERNSKIGEGVRRRNKENPEILQRSGAKIRKAKARRFKCLITGYVGNASAVSQYQIKHGIDHKDPTNRVQIK